MPTEYPKRPGFFAYRYCRLMGKVCLANELGPNVCWLLTTIAMTEDAKGYRDAVTFFNEQLMAVTGLNSVDALSRARTKAIEAGWLHYIPGAKGKAGRYWVLTPERFRTFDDAPSDESPSKYFRDLPTGKRGDNAEESEMLSTKRGSNPRECAEESRGKAEGMCGENPRECAEHSSLTQNSLTLPLPQEPKTVGEVIELAKFDELIQLWKSNRLPGWEQVQRTSTRAGWFQQRLAEDAWRNRWRDAVNRAGRSARCMGHVEGWTGLRIDTFLKSADWVQRLLEGEFDDAPASPLPKPSAVPAIVLDPFAAIAAKYEGAKS